MRALIAMVSVAGRRFDHWHSWVVAAIRPGSNAVESGVLVAEPEDVAVVGGHPLQAAPVLGLVHLAQASVR